MRNSALTGKQDSLSGGSYTDGKNIDNVKGNIVIWFNANSTGIKPFDDYGLLFAFQNEFNTVQLAFPFGAVNKVKWRMHVNGEWQSWRDI